MPKILAIDYGTKRIGLAIADRKEKLAVPYTTIENKREDFVIQELRKICREEDIGEIVVGMPYQKLKTQSSKACGERSRTIKNMVEGFVKVLRAEFDIPILIEDERMTSKLADRLKEEWGEKVEQDAIAAAAILQSYLDRGV